MANPSLNAPNSDDKLWAGLGYAGLVCCMVPTIVIFLLKKGESDYIKFHNLQAMGFWLAIVVIQVLLNSAGFIPGIGMVAGLISLLLGIATLGLWIYLMIVGFTGQDFKIPILADFIENNLMK